MIDDLRFRIWDLFLVLMDHKNICVWVCVYERLEDQRNRLQTSSVNEESASAWNHGLEGRVRGDVGVSEVWAVM